ncbi:hypothetical protein OG806_47920 [Streptomyces sp. NBC_00882]|nr:hypothetical protein OG806_47920 [Streptomyces sp. NBC_00882]WSZ63524.1 hypothetical protein OH824_46765 [Streptomyces canus]
MTSGSVQGAYPEQDQDEQYPIIGYGHPKDRRFDLQRDADEARPNGAGR